MGKDVTRRVEHFPIGGSDGGLQVVQRGLAPAMVSKASDMDRSQPNEGMQNGQKLRRSAATPPPFNDASLEMAKSKVAFTLQLIAAA